MRSPNAWIERCAELLGDATIDPAAIDRIIRNEQAQHLARRAQQAQHLESIRQGPVMERCVLARITMKQLNLDLLSAVALCVCGCATKQATMTYWTEKSGVAVVHHIVGKVDSIEKLSEKPLPADEVADLPKGKYFQVVESHADAPAKPIKQAKDPKKDTDAPRFAELTSKINDLKRQISTVAAQNQRLQEQINTSAPQPTPTPEQPRLSQ
jgi:hypothetical protein